MACRVIPALHLPRKLRTWTLLCQSRDWTTNDPLGAGALLGDACRVAQLMIGEVNVPPDLLEDILYSARLSLDYSSFEKMLFLDAGRRLAFREFGLSIGLHSLKRIQKWIAQFPSPFRHMASLSHEVEKLLAYEPMARAIESFWIRSDNQNAASWTDHRDINSVYAGDNADAGGFPDDLSYCPAGNLFSLSPV